MVEQFGSYIKRFGRGLPGLKIILAFVISTSLIFGTASIYLLHYKDISQFFAYLTLRGLIFSIMSVLVPTLLTVLFIKLIARDITLRHILFLAFIGEIAFCIYLVLSSILEIAFSSSVAIIALLVGTASLYGWWFFIGRILILKRSKSAAVPFVQPTLYLVFYIFALQFIFAEKLPLNVLLTKLYAGMAVFVLVIYSILYIFNKPSKKSLGFDSINAFSAVFRDWLFGISTAKPFGSYGTQAAINVDMLLFSGKKTNAMFFIPGIHYGPMGSMCSSNFPYLLESYAERKYNMDLFAMHAATNEDLNAASSSQISKFFRIIDDAIKNAKFSNSAISFEKGEFGNAHIQKLKFDNCTIASFSRAPRVTEDIAPEAAVLFSKVLEEKGRNVIIIDEHNSRYESAPKDELEGVKINSIYAEEYLNAEKNMKLLHSSKSVNLGIGSVELYQRLSKPLDLAKGKLNVAVFQFNGFKHAIIQFNANNMLPSLRKQILAYISKHYKMSAEVYTTDTHAVNSIGMSASNVLGRHTSFSSLRRPIDLALNKAIKNIEEVKVCYERKTIPNFMVWGYNSRAQLFSVVNSVIALARILVPTIIIAGFAIATLVIYEI